MKGKKILSILTIFVILFLITSCSSKETSVEDFNQDRDFHEIVEEARGDTVTFYGWGGDENRNKWLSNTVAPRLKEEYDITLDVVGMDIGDILAKLSGEKQAGLQNGSIDMIWINGENFYSAKENNLLFGPFADSLPNFEKYIDPNDEEVKNDFGYPIEGYEAPYSKAQLVFINDKNITEETPNSAQEFMDYCKKYKGQVTYPALPDFTGSAFIRTIIYDLVGHEQFLDMKADKETVKEAIRPALEYLRELNPYLWNEGKTFPSTIGEVHNMFQDEELVMTMTYIPYLASTNIDKGIYPDSVRTFLFEKGTVGNTNYIAIAKNSSKKAAAMVAINEIISSEVQLSQFEELKELTVVSHDKLSEEEKERFKNVDIGQGVLTQEELLYHRLPEMSSSIVLLIEEIWLEEVVGK